MNLTVGNPPHLLRIYPVRYPYYMIDAHIVDKFEFPFPRLGWKCNEREIVFPFL